MAKDIEGAEHGEFATKEQAGTPSTSLRTPSQSKKKKRNGKINIFSERRIVVLKPAGIPRMYHSSVVLVPDGRVLVGESNLHEMDNFRRTFPTDLNLEVFHPPYLAPLFASLRPSILTVETRDDTLPERGVYRRRFELGNKARRRRDIRDVSVACRGMIGKFNKRTASDRDGEHGGQRKSGEIKKGIWVVSVQAAVILEKSKESNGN
ncbi:hypothetical protein TB2_006007 [Malus domestica]